MEGCNGGAKKCAARKRPRPINPFGLATKEEDAVSPMNSECASLDRGMPQEEYRLMSAFFVLTDGRAWSKANWAYDAVLDAIADALPNDGAGQLLAEWLLEQRCRVQGPGVGTVDLRELTDENRRRIVEAIPRALEMARKKGPRDWHDPSFFPQWLSAFELLVQMIESAERGDPPEALNPDMRGPIPPTGERRGPGW